MKRLAAVLLAALLVLSGCVSVFDTGTTSTPEELNPAKADLPPGVNESGVTNVSALVTAHNKTLRTEGFVLNGTLVRDSPKSGNWTRTFHTVVAPDAEQFLIEGRSVIYDTNNSGSSVTQRFRIWANSSLVIRQSTTPTNNNTIILPRGEASWELALMRAPHYEIYLKIGAFSVDRVVARDGHTFTTLIANDTFVDLPKNSTFTARFVVDERGVIHEAVVDIDWGPNNRANHVEYRVVQLGASPERPEWVANTSDKLMAADLLLSEASYAGSLCINLCEI